MNNRKQQVPFLAIFAVFFLLAATGCTQPRLGKGTSTESFSEFKGVRWGSSLEDAKDLIVVESKGNYTYAKRKDGDFTFGSAAIAKMIYLFEDDKFKQVIIDFEGPENFEFIKTELFRRHGKPVHSDPRMSTYIWRIQNANLSAMLRYYRSGNGTMNYTYFPK